MVNDVIRQRLTALTARAALRSMTVRPAPEGYALASAWRVVCCGSLDQLSDWLAAAEAREIVAPPVVDSRADC